MVICFFPSTWIWTGKEEKNLGGVDLHEKRVIGIYEGVERSQGERKCHRDREDFLLRTRLGVIESILFKMTQ